MTRLVARRAKKTEFAEFQSALRAGTFRLIGSAADGGGQTVYRVVGFSEDRRGVGPGFELRQLLVELSGPSPASVAQPLPVGGGQRPMFGQLQSAASLTKFGKAVSDPERGGRPFVEPLPRRVRQLAPMPCSDSAPVKAPSFNQPQRGAGPTSACRTPGTSAGPTRNESRATTASNAQAALARHDHAVCRQYPDAPPSCVPADDVAAGVTTVKPSATCCEPFAWASRSNHLSSRPRPRCAEATSEAGQGRSRSAHPPSTSNRSCSARQ